MKQINGVKLIDTCQECRWLELYNGGQFARDMERLAR